MSEPQVDELVRQILKTLPRVTELDEAIEDIRRGLDKLVPGIIGEPLCRIRGGSGNRETAVRQDRISSQTFGPASRDLDGILVQGQPTFIDRPFTNFC